ncbi:hypothetical protein DID88_006703 [Monilinia fructigena]|uniref:Uncharacterized protein n=1 Tax=Monilinia fructigena TaxID=38457 RepID=A0A395IFJ4_9HELO|nr:hypothetical protein DID88_006703 [Monilinia fructigena]
MGYNPQSSSTIVPFPTFANTKNVNPYNAPTAIPQHREAADTRTASPEDPTPISNRRQIILPRAKQSSSTSDKSSEPPNTIPDNPHSARQEDWPSGMEQKTSIYIQNPTRQEILATNYMSPGHESRMKYDLGQGTFEENRVSDSTRASYGNIYGIFSSTIDESSYRPILETKFPRQYYSAHVERLDAEKKPVISSSHETRVKKEHNDLPAHKNKPQSSISGFAKTVVVTKPSTPSTNPTRTAPANMASSTCSRPGKRRLSPQIRASQRLPQLQRSLYPKPADPSSCLTPPGPFSVKPSATLPPVSQMPQSIDPLILERPHRPYSSAPSTSLNRSITPLNQEVTLQSGEESSSTPTALPAKRPISPVIRVAKVLRRQTPL